MKTCSIHPVECQLAVLDIGNRPENGWIEVAEWRALTQQLWQVRIGQRTLAHCDDVRTLAKHLVGFLRIVQAAIGDQRNTRRVATGQFDQAGFTLGKGRLPCFMFGHMDVIDAGIGQRIENDFGIALVPRPFVLKVVDLAL